MDDQRFAHDAAGRHARIQGAVWVLEHHSHLAPDPPQVCAFGAGDVFAFQEHLAFSGLLQANNGPACCGLAGTALANQAKCFALIHGEANAVNGLYFTDAALKYQSACDRKVDFQVSDLK